MINFEAKQNKVLDCTLREGGYLNNWEFGKKFIEEFILKLSSTNIEYIEVGFLKDGNFSENQTLFNQIEDINKIIPTNINSKICAMIMVEEFDVEKIIPKTQETKLDCIRISFKKHQIDKLESYIKKIKGCGYEVFVNPTYIDEYSDLELITIFEKINTLKPNYISLVDTKGFLSKNDVTRIFYLMDRHFDKNIAFCCHLHNNIYRAFENSKRFIKECFNKRNLIIDSTILGLGRGVGNLPTEQIALYLNENYEKEYDLIQIINLLNDKIYPIFKEKQESNPSKYFLEKFGIKLG